MNMNINRRSAFRAALVTTLMLLMIGSARLRADTGTCGGASITLPFTDVAAGNVFFCSIAEAFFSGLSNGTSATTYSPSVNVTREQMAAFVSRTMDQSLKRGSARAALDQYWTPTSLDGLGLTTVGTTPQLIASDGADLWVANNGSGTVSRVRASDGKMLSESSGAASAFGILAAKGAIWVTGQTSPGKLYIIDPAVGSVSTLPISLGNSPGQLSFDGARIWTANQGGSVSIVTLNPLSVSTVTAGFGSPRGILYDGANMWVTDYTASRLLKLDSNGAIIQTVVTGAFPLYSVFDGTNIWVPNNIDNTVTVVRASTGAVLAELSANGLSGPNAAAFDGERILVTNGLSLSLWKAADLSPLGIVSTGLNAPFGACSLGPNFWIALYTTNKLARF